MCIVYALNEPEHRKHINELKNTHNKHSWDEQQAVVGGIGGKERTPSNLARGEVMFQSTDKRLMKKRVENAAAKVKRQK